LWKAVHQNDQRTVALDDHPESNPIGLDHFEISVSQSHSAFSPARSMASGRSMSMSTDNEIRISLKSLDDARP
jgi:hypothetical protein